MSVKGDWERPKQTTREEQELRKAYMHGEITLRTYNMRFNKLKKAGLITRSGKAVT